MLNIDTTLIIATVIGATSAAALVLFIATQKAKLRSYELKTANKALRTYYTLMDDIIDDPALPDEAAEFLAFFSEVIPHREDCNNISSRILKSSGKASRSSGNSMFHLIEDLGKTRPDLREKFHKAVANGIIAMFHRWPNNSWKFAQTMQEIASDPKKEYQLVYKLASSQAKQQSGTHAVA